MVKKTWKQTIIIWLLQFVLRHYSLYYLFNWLIKTDWGRRQEKRIREGKANVAITDLQQDVVPLIQRMYSEGKINFTTSMAKPASKGHYWVPLEPVAGTYLVEIFQLDPDKAVKLGVLIARDFQKVVQEFFKDKPIPNRWNGEILLWLNLIKWSASIVQWRLWSPADRAKYISFAELRQLVRDIERLLRKEGEKVWGITHGNLTGNHTFLSTEGVLYIWGIWFNYRFGGEIYDILRLLDWYLLYQAKSIKDFDQTVRWMKQHLADQDWEQVKIFMAIRGLGDYGWDMGHLGEFDEDHLASDFSILPEIFLRLIRRDY